MPIGNHFDALARHSGLHGKLADVLGNGDHGVAGAAVLQPICPTVGREEGDSSAGHAFDWKADRREPRQGLAAAVVGVDDLWHPELKVLPPKENAKGVGGIVRR